MLNQILAYIRGGSQRTVRAKKNILAMFMLRGISIICSLIVVPLTIDYVSKYEYGIWLTISSLVAWLSFFDIGIGNGLRNKFIESIEKKEYEQARVYVSTAYAIISIVVTCVWIVAIIVSLFINWPEVLNADVSLSNELLYTVLIVITNFSILFVLGLNRTLLNAIQKPALASMFDTSTQVLLCLVLLILTSCTKGNLIYLALAMGTTSMLTLIISNIWTYTRLLKGYRPSLKFVRFKSAKGIMSLGIMFFFLQILAIAFYQTNNLIISHYLGPDEVTTYNIAFKYLQVLPMVFTIIITPFWSAFAEANVNNDYEWMKNVRKRLIQALSLLGLCGCIMVVISSYVYDLWIGNKVQVPFIVTTLVFIFQMLNMWGSMWTQLLSGLGKIRLQVICSSICCLSYIPISCYFCDKYGLNGLLTVSIALPLICTSWFGAIQTHKLLNKSAKGLWNK